MANGKCALESMVGKMENRKDRQYYNAIMGKGEDSFKNIFEKKWMEYIDNFSTVHKNARQLRIGNRLRPCMVCWGHALATTHIEEMDFEAIVDLAIGIELIHKGSIIIDDYIDDDSARRGEITFHKEYSANETIMFLLFLLGKATEQLTKFVSPTYVSSLICSMANGALRELQLTSTNCFDSGEIDKIVSGETIALIKDSFLFGYRTRKNCMLEMDNILESVAYKCAYSFQLLNDLEPFSAIEQNVKYKQNHNFDFEKNRKNLVLVRLYQKCMPSDRELIQTHINDNELFSVLFALIDKYDMKAVIIEEVEESKKNIIKDLRKMSLIVDNRECLEDFLMFIDDTINLCYLRV